MASKISVIILIVAVSFSIAECRRASKPSKTSTITAATSAPDTCVPNNQWACTKPSSGCLGSPNDNPVRCLSLIYGRYNATACSTACGANCDSSVCTECPRWGSAGIIEYCFKTVG